MARSTQLCKPPVTATFEVGPRIASPLAIVRPKMPLSRSSGASSYGRTSCSRRSSCDGDGASGERGGGRFAYDVQRSLLFQRRFGGHILRVQRNGDRANVCACTSNNYDKDNNNDSSKSSEYVDVVNETPRTYPRRKGWQTNYQVDKQGL